MKERGQRKKDVRVRVRVSVNEPTMGLGLKNHQNSLGYLAWLWFFGAAHPHLAFRQLAVYVLAVLQVQGKSSQQDLNLEQSLP